MPQVPSQTINRPGGRRKDVFTYAKLQSSPVCFLKKLLEAGFHQNEGTTHRRGGLGAGNRESLGQRQREVPGRWGGSTQRPAAVAKDQHDQHRLEQGRGGGVMEENERGGGEQETVPDPLWVPMN